MLTVGETIMKTKPIGFRLTKEEMEALNKIAVSMNYYYGGNPNFTKVLKDIAKGDLIISKKIP